MRIFQSIIFRYLAKEVFITLVSLTAILLLIFMSNQFILYLNRAANGQIPLLIIMKLMMLEVPNLMSLLLPLGFYIAILIAYGRLYADSEMTVLMACGYSLAQLLKHSFVMATFLALFVAAIMIWISPVIATERAKLLQTTGYKTLLQTLGPGRFQEYKNLVFYIDSMNKDHTQARQVFLARLNEKNEQWDILFAEKAYLEMDNKTQEDYLVLENGREYQGMPGANDFQILEFSKANKRLPNPKEVKVKEDLRTEKTASLLPWLTADPKKAAEFQWRISIPLMVFTLTLVALPLSRVNPRAGKFSKLLPAIILFIIYANFLFVFRGWVGAGKIPLWVGMWPLHLVMVLIGIGLIWVNRIRLG